MNSNITLCVGASFRSINSLECLISRLGGSILIIISFFSILFNIRYLYWLSYHRQHRSQHNLFLFSMIFSSFLLIIIIVPSVILQCLTCSRLCSLFYCQLEGFISYLNGCVHMFMLMMISIIRYDILLHTNKTKKYFRKHSYIAMIICWLFAMIFALPPLFNWNKYIPEGLGFHCGLNWIDRSISSRLYLILAFLFVYFIPLLVLSIVNIHVYRVIHHLLQRASKQTLMKSTLAARLLKEKCRSLSISSSNCITTGHSNKFKIDLSKSMIMNNHLRTYCSTDPVTRLKADRRFALATIFLVSEYLLSWTPYACVALLYLFHMKFIIEQPLFITICAFIAKISMIINPCIYILTIKTNQFKIILFWKKCSCQTCTINRNIN